VYYTPTTITSVVAHPASGYQQDVSGSGTYYDVAFQSAHGEVAIKIHLSGGQITWYYDD
jgi:hypothetical protein